MTAPVVDPVLSGTPRLGKSAVTVETISVPRRVRVSFAGYEPTGSPALGFVVACLVVAVAAVWVNA